MSKKTEWPNQSVQLPDGRCVVQTVREVHRADGAWFGIATTENRPYYKDGFVWRPVMTALNEH